MTRRASEMLDRVYEVVSPRKALERKQCRFAYDVLDGTRIRKKRSGTLNGTGDAQLDEAAHADLMEISRDLCRNNPLAKGLLGTERDGIVGLGPMLHPATSSETLNNDLTELWREYMIDQAIDHTGRFNWPSYCRRMYLGCVRDGDSATIYGERYLRAVEADQIGTPYGKGLTGANVYNGVVYSNTTGKLIGYYVGTPDRWGYIQSTSYQAIPAENMHVMFDPERFSQSRGEPALTPSIDWIDKLCSYVDAELIAAKVQACFCVFIAKKEDFSSGLPQGYTGGVSTSGYDEDGNRLEKVEPGTIFHGMAGEEATPIGMNRPGGAFGEFMNKILVLIGRPLAMPLMLVTLDFTGATFMNAKIGYDRKKEHWMGKQNECIKPFASRTYRWFVDLMIREGRINNPPADVYRHRVGLNRWPYVDPFKAAQANQAELDMGSISEFDVCEAAGREYEEVCEARQRAKKIRQQYGLDEPKAAKPATVPPSNEDPDNADDTTNN